MNLLSVYHVGVQCVFFNLIIYLFVAPSYQPQLSPSSSIDAAITINQNYVDQDQNSIPSTSTGYSNESHHQIFHTNVNSNSSYDGEVNSTNPFNDRTIQVSTGQDILTEQQITNEFINIESQTNGNESLLVQQQKIQDISNFEGESIKIYL